MKFEEKHVVIIDNLLKTFRRCEIPGAKGEEMLAFAMGYYFLHDLKNHVVNDIKQAPIIPKSKDSPVKTEKKTKKTKKGS